MSTPLPERGDIPRGVGTQVGAATSANDSVNPTDSISLPGTPPDSHILEPRQSPPAQVMEKSDDAADPNRIPSSVFARSKSTTPMEWSVASNESLFSIHVGNSSFSKENVVSPMASYSVHAETDSLQPPAEAEEHAQKERRPAEQAALPPSLSHCSAESFAFPMYGSLLMHLLTGERKSGSFKGEPGHPLQPEKAEQLPLQTGTPKAAPAAAESRWFSCFSCCSSCC
ncbi:hypothetical protein BHE74_00045459 [Ensete ventricosum]|nr:hypothetical protein GW17_00035349 [Ensete ventricosum]RWW48491.1 hypothetical protein BHE74_00045459 [Ensete ventricosum]RZR99236.1 hypothetical protein BHM03_00028738 [Ensete ventricosum]